MVEPPKIEFPMWFEIKRLKNGKYVYLFDDYGFQHYVGPLNQLSLTVCLDRMGLNDLIKMETKIRESLEKRGLDKYVEMGVKAYLHGYSGFQHPDPKVNAELNRINARIDVLKYLIEPILEELPKARARRITMLKYQLLSDKEKVKLLEEIRGYF